MKVAIMQPYIFPYIGYFQLINAVDKFVIYDNIEFTKKGWINRNRLLCNGKDYLFSLPLKKDSDFLYVNQRVLSNEFLKSSIKFLRKIENDYRLSPYFDKIFPIIQMIYNDSENNLFIFIYKSINKIMNYLNIDTELIISSEIPINHNLKSQEKVISICNELSASCYINPIGGKELYSKNDFSKNKLALSFLKPKIIEYQQFGNDFVSFLSIIDVLMFNSREEVIKMLDEYELV